MSKIDRLKTIDPPDRPAAHTPADPLPMLVASTANENVAAEGRTHKRDPLWPRILIGFAFCLTLLWSAFLVWGAVKLMKLTLG